MSAEMHSEFELLKASLRGDTGAFEAIVRKYQSFICAITFSATGNVDKSEELAQETFVSAWKDLAKLKDLNKFRGWLSSIARNIVRNSFRSQERDLISKAAGMDEVKDFGIRDSEPEEEAISKERQAVVRQALGQIPERYREPLVLYYRQGQSIRQVAEQLELSEETVKQRLCRGRNLVKEQIATMVETTISRTGPGKAFTAGVIAVVTGMVVKGSSAAATAGVAESSITGITCATTVMSGMTAKIIAAAAVAVMGVGAVLVYEQMKGEEEALLPDAVNSMQVEEGMEDVGRAMVLGNESVEVRVWDDEEEIAGENAAVIATVVPPATAEAQNKSEDTKAEYVDWAPERLSRDSGPYNHLVFVREDRAGGSDVRTLVVAGREESGWKIRPVHSARSYEWSTLGVARGKVYSMIGYKGELFELDLNSGERRLVAGNLKKLHYHPSGRLYCVRDDRFAVYDFERGAFRDIMERPFASELCSYTRMVVSADERRMVFCELGSFEKWSKAEDLAGAESIPADWDDVRLVVVDLESGKQTRMPVPFGSPFSTGGGRLHKPAPPLAWMDSNTVLVVRKDRAFCGVAVVDVTTGEMWDVAGLPGGHDTTPSFGTDKDGQVRVYLTKEKMTSTYAIDFEVGSLFEENSLGSFFDFGYVDGARHILHGGKCIEESGEATMVAVSPDGKQIAWTRLVKDWRYKGLFVCDTNAPALQKVCDDYINSGPMWVSDSDMLDGEPPEAPAGWARLTTEPWPLAQPDKRPSDAVTEQVSLGDVLALGLSTDKQAYRQHEPVKLTVWIRNKTSDDLTFKVGRGGSDPLQISVTHSDGGGHVGFGMGEERFPAEPLELKAYESVSRTEIIEPYVLGEHRVSSWLRCASSGWSGRATAESIGFVVRESADYERLLKEKFDREIERFHSGFPSKISLGKLGPDALKYLISELENSKDKKFRRQMGRALKGMLCPEMLPFLRSCLTEEMKADYEDILDILLMMHERSMAPDEALDLLILALSHSNPRVRANASERIRVIKDRRVAEAFAGCVGDDDEETATTAARYLAAGEGLELSDWFGVAAEQPTEARYVAACSIIRELEKSWNVTYGDIGALPWEELSKDDDLLTEFSSIVRAWEQWARKNPKLSGQFFK